MNGPVMRSRTQSEPVIPVIISSARTTAGVSSRSVRTGKTPAAGTTATAESAIRHNHRSIGRTLAT
jgi:hypothetical protein